MLLLGKICFGAITRAGGGFSTEKEGGAPRCWQWRACCLTGSSMHPNTAVHASRGKQRHTHIGPRGCSAPTHQSIHPESAAPKLLSTRCVWHNFIDRACGCAFFLFLSLASSLLALLLPWHPKSNTILYICARGEGGGGGECAREKERNERVNWTCKPFSVRAKAALSLSALLYYTLSGFIYCARIELCAVWAHKHRKTASVRHGWLMCKTFYRAFVLLNALVGLHFLSPWCLCGAWFAARTHSNQTYTIYTARSQTRAPDWQQTIKEETESALTQSSRRFCSSKKVVKIALTNTHCSCLYIWALHCT